MENDIKLEELSEGNQKLHIDFYDYNKLVLEYYNGNVENEYAYYVYCNDRIVKRIKYSHNPKCTYRVEEKGTYKIKVFVKDRNGDKKSSFSDEIDYKAENILYETNEKRTVARKVFSIIKEIITNWSMMIRVALFDYKLENKDSYLGKFWDILTPLIQIGTFWLVFGLGMRQGKDMDGYPYLLWMLSGLIPWFCISTSITKGANSIFSKSANITKLRFPIATVPIGTIVTQGFEFAFTMIILEVCFLCQGYLPNWGYINLIYYTVYMLAFLASLALVTSVCTMVARDFQKLLGAVIRLLFYITPILWDMSKMPEVYQKIIGVSPIYYIVRGFRDSLLYRTPFYEHKMDMLIAWVMVVLLFVLGCYLQEKFRNRFIDLV